MSHGPPAPRHVVVVAGRDPLEEEGGGHSSYVCAHAHALRRAGFDPHLFAVSRTRGTVEMPYGFLHRIPARVLPRRQLFAMVYGSVLARAIVRFARTRPGPHLLHGFGVWAYAGVLAARALVRRGMSAVAVTSGYTAYAEESGSLVSGVARAHGVRKRVRYAAEHAWVLLALGRFEREAYEGASRVLVNYETVREMLARRYRIAGKVRRVAYTPPGAFERADAPGAPRAESASPPLVVSVSRHDPRKGVDVLLEALARLRADGVAFRAVVASGGRLLEAHRRLATRLGLDGSVTLPGFVPDVPALLRSADVYVLPSRREQSGSVALLEALQAGVAVVASRCDGVPEDVEDGVSGLLAEPGDPVSLAAALRRVLGDAGLRARLATGARALYERRFRPEALVDALLREYADLGVTP